MPNKVDNLSTKMASALFTIEQIELIRRLRNSGITKEQVSMAFDQMDRLDIELGKPSTSNRSNIPQYPAICSSLQALDRIDQDSSPVQSQMTNGVSKNELFYNKNQGESYSRPQSSSNSSTDGATDNGQNGDAVSPVANNNSSSTTCSLSNELTIIPLSSSSAPSVPVSYSSADGVTVQSHIYNSRSADGASNCVPIQCLVNPLDLLQDECYELDELKKLVAVIRFFFFQISYFAKDVI